MQVRYFVHHQGKSVGPLSFQEIEARLNSKDLFPTDYVYVGEKGDWLPMLEFIMVHGPKEKVMQPALQTLGANSPADDQLDWKRFTSGIPAALGTHRDAGLSIQAYPTIPHGVDVAPPEPPVLETAPSFPPPPKPPRSVRERKMIEETLRKKATPPPPVRKPPQAPRPILRPPVKPAPPSVDASAVARVEVLPAQATRLTIQITGTARVGEDLEILVVAQTEAGDVDQSFNDVVEIACDRPLGGMAPLQFMNGTARLRVRCLSQGTHQFSLVLNNTAKGPFAKAEAADLRHQTGFVH